MEIVSITSVSGPQVRPGDSGGPLMIRKNSFQPWFSMGIVSFGSFQLDLPTAFTKVDSYFEWIEKKLKP